MDRKPKKKGEREKCYEYIIIVKGRFGFPYLFVCWQWQTVTSATFIVNSIRHRLTIAAVCVCVLWTLTKTILNERGSTVKMQQIGYT